SARTDRPETGRRGRACPRWRPRSVFPCEGKASAFPAALRDYCPIRVNEIIMASAVLTISSKNYSSWSLRGWLMCQLGGLEVAARSRPTDDPATRAELLLLSPSFLVPALEHDGVTVWDTLSIAD